MFYYIAIIVTLFKVLLIPSYHSTDFEVHRNWMAITYNKPWFQWYVESTSKWTIDYPPLFAWFEYFLSQIASIFDPEMLIISKDGFFSQSTLIFMRFSVIVSDFVLLYAVQRLTKCMRTTQLNTFLDKNISKDNLKSSFTIFQILVLCNMGLIVVDHIHFQYNGLLLGILLLSISHVLMDNYCWGTFWFVILLCMKHIFIYMAPMYFIYFLRNYCCLKEKYICDVKRLLKLCAIVLGVLIISFGPFIIVGQTSKLLARLFPFKRGLTHAYWAPNIWALYNFIDRILCFLGSKLGYAVNCKVGHLTGGIVAVSSYAVLPTIKPILTFILTLTAMFPCLYKLWKGPSNVQNFIRGLIIGTSSAFVFGWHVHEKAILMVIIPFCILAVTTKQDAQVFAFLSTVGHFSLLPLLFTTNEIILKYFLFVLQTWYTISSLTNRFNTSLLTSKQKFYLLGLPGLFFLEMIGFYSHKYPFLPLMAISVYCSLGVIYTYVHYYKNFMCSNLKGRPIKGH